MQWRIGMFMVFTSLIILVSFFASLQQDSLYLNLFCSGIILLILGGAAMWRGRSPAPPQSERFRLLRKRAEKTDNQEEGQE